MIALSIAVSAAHALRPLVRGGEAKIAFAFGLVHGLVFAEVLRALGLHGRDLVLSVARLQPRHRADAAADRRARHAVALRPRGLPGYNQIRIVVGSLAFVAAFAWLLERVGAVGANPVGSGGDFVLVSHRLWLVGALGVAAALALVTGRDAQPQPALTQ